jgi:cytochrome b
MTTTSNRVLVWDAPVRVFHWLLAASFIGAFVTAESERWRLVHVTLGYTVGGLVLFRLLWGLVGTRHARFAAFVRGPRAVAGYLRSLLSGNPQHTVGHNPAGALAIVGLLGGALLLVGSGWATYNDLGPGFLEDLHEGLGNGLLALVVVHVLGVIVSSRLHGENLVRAMVTGHKQGTPDEGIRHAWRSLAVLMLAAVLGFWGWQYNQAPDASTLADQAQTQLAERPRHGHHGDRDHD